MLALSSVSRKIAKSKLAAVVEECRMVVCETVSKVVPSGSATSCKLTVEVEDP